MNILIIEDEKEIADGVSSILQKEGYQTDTVYDGLQGLDSGADDYLSKPFDAGELLARIRARTRGSGTPTDNGLAIGDVRLERAAHKLCGTYYTSGGLKEYEMPM